MPKIPMYQKIYEDVLASIRTGEASPGDRIDSEDSLAEKYGVSRITTKKALSLLGEEGYIIRKPGKGSFVADSASVAAVDRKVKDTVRKKLGFIIDYVGNSFALNLFNQISLQGTETGYDMLISVSHASQEVEMRAIDAMKQSGCNGIILVPVLREFYNQEIIRSIADHYPILTIDRELAGLPSPCVSTDHRKASAELTAYLIQREHKHIAFFHTRPNVSKSEGLRASGYHDMMVQHALSDTASIFTPTVHFGTHLLPFAAGIASPDSEAQQKIAQIEAEILTFFDANPHVTAVVCCTHPMAYLTYTLLMRMGKSIPADISIVCFDEMEQIQRTVHFTHFHQNEIGIAQHALQLMGTLISDGVTTENAANIFVPGSIVEGNTVRAISE
ncbi:substrate-binding domain-containing protein [Ruminococcaceae bacterium OttesenSCG-928-L11]|nr:substrate-binding domain-containing protein [Ruminococcaceae bacterium OttesenSCG-928-L11]